MWICRGFSGAVARISTGAWAAAGEVTASSPQHTAPINGDIGAFIRSISKPSARFASVVARIAPTVPVARGGRFGQERDMQEGIARIYSGLGADPPGRQSPGPGTR